MVDDGHKNRWCMYLWIVQGPTQKKMRKGKAAGQVAHAAARLAREVTDKEWIEYLNYEVKIVYKVSTPEQLMELYNDIYALEVRKTLVYDSTWGKYTVFGLFTKDDPNVDGRWKLA